MAEFEAPQSRNEAILQNMLGANNALSPPESRIENLLIQILNQGGGGDNVFIATYGTTASGDIAAAINTRKIIIVAKGANVPSEIAVAAQVDGTRVYLHTTEIRTEGTRTAPIFMKTVVDGTTWTTEEIAVATEEQTPFLATINVTTNAQLTEAINAGHPILVKAQGDGQPIYSVLYAMKLTSGVVHLITANIVADEEMNNRLRPTFHSYDVDGSTWTALAPVTALVPRDLANIVMTLPETGVLNMRYLLYVPDNSAVGYHYDEYLYVNRNWIYISKDKTFVATIGTTTAATLKDAINAGKIIYVKTAGENEPYFISTMVQVAANDDITLNCAELVHDSQRDIYVPIYTRHSVNGTTNVWTSATVEALPFLATINTTPETALKAAIDSKREILVTTAGTNRPYQTALYADNKGDNGVYLICAKITEDTERWNRLRPTFEAWTIKGTVWTAADPLEAVVEDDLANIMNALPTAGVPKTRYLLKVPDISSEGYHLDEYIYTENKWICISRDNVVRVKTNVTTEAELTAAIEAGKTILITDTEAASEAVVHCVVGTGYVDLYTVEQDATKAAMAPRFCRHRVVGAAWTKTAADLGAFLATVNVTTEAALKELIGAQREMLLTTGEDQPYHTVIYAEDKGDDGAYIISADITVDTDRWDRLRPTFHAFTIRGNVWTAADPLEAVVEDDLANILTELPTTGVPKTRYLLKVPDISTEGYHLDEYIYTENKWICISRDNVIRVKPNVTTETELSAAISAGKTILITDTATESRAVVHSFVGTGYVDLYSVEYDTAEAAVSPGFVRHRVVGAAWTETVVGLGAFVATVDSTTELALKGAIGERREILVTTGDNQPYYTVVYAEDKGTDGAYIVVSGIVTDTAHWNRKRSRFTAYTILGNLWTAADPIDALIAEDLTNIVTALPTTGVANTRYLLKVTDASTVGYHLDEYIYTDGKWVYISKEQPAPFIATIKVTSQAEIMAAINSNSPIYIYSDITGMLWPAISAVANAFNATVRYLTVGSSSGNYTVDIVSNRVAGTTWTPTTISLATKDDLEKYVPKLATAITESTTNYIRAFKMNADGLLTGTSGTYTKTDTVSSSSTTNQLPSAKSVRDFVATPSEVSLTYNTTYISANYSKCYKVAERIYMCNIAFQAKGGDIPANTWLIRFPENIVSSGAEVYCVMHCTDRTTVPATLLLQMGGSANFNQFCVKTNPFTGNKYYFGNVMIIKTA